MKYQIIYLRKNKIELVGCPTESRDVFRDTKEKFITNSNIGGY